MFSLARFVALSLALFGVAEAAPSLLSVASTTGPTRPGGYIVTLKSGAVARRSLTSVHRSLLSSFSASESDIKYEWPRLNAFAGTFSDAALLALRSSSEVAAIEHDTIGGVDEILTQTDATWGLQRISQVDRLDRSNYSALDYTYVYDSSGGKGVDIYIIDTGINLDHQEFEGRARWGLSLNGYPQRDGYGHGSHVAGTAAGKRVGVAKAANLVAVRILSDSGSGTVSDAIAGVNWVIEEVTTRTHAPSVINMSLRFSPSDVLDAAVTSAVANGVHVAVSAGNAATQATTQSPARAEAVITVGATTINDTIASFSNFGPRVDIFAPGENILSVLASSNTSYTLNSGTSMATPHVAGLVAYVVGLEGDKSTAEVLARIQEWSPDGIITRIPANTNNELINNGANL
ncbi:peptidase 1 [Auricularia subglabra TFB-10046 SS5]|nr:peptidase 1 [Auricularia subglabra TFB-10046 SS5]